MHTRRLVPVIALCASMFGFASPLLAQVMVTSDLVMEHFAGAGEHYEGAVRLHNSSANAERAVLAVTDYAFSADGTSRLGAMASHARSSGPWMTLSQTRVTLPPRGDATVPFAVTVPSDNALAGTFWCALTVQTQRDAPNPGAAAGVQVGVVIQYAVQVVTHIGTTGTSAADFVESSIAAGHIDIDVTNTGTRAYRPVLRAQVFSEAGALESDATFNRGLLYPTTSLRQSVPLPHLAPGTYTLLMVADVGSDDVQGAKFTFTVR